jgi:hypothetical protein
METVTLKGKDFTLLHNSLCELRTVQQQLSGVISDTLAERLQRVVRDFEDSLDDAYAQDNTAFDRKHDHYRTVQQQLGLKTIWSLYEVPDLAAEHPYTAAREICYRDHWGKEAVYETIPGDTWAALYTAADRCIRRSGDDHHVFIEAFEPVANQPHQLRLTTGS